MFSSEIVGSDAFVDMPMSAQALYFHLCLDADDDGFISRPKQVMRMVGANDDDLRILIAKRFLLEFADTVAVVKHWLIHNLIRADLYVETTYKQEKSSLGLNEFGAYTELREGVIPIKQIEEPNWLKRRRAYNRSSEVGTSSARKRTANGTQTVQTRHVGKDRLGKDRLVKDTNVSLPADKPAEPKKEKSQKPKVKTADIDHIFKHWESVVGYGVTSNVKSNREAVANIIRENPMENIEKMISGVAMSHEDQYAPRISNFIQLYRKWDDLKAWGRRSMKQQGQGGIKI